MWPLRARGRGGLGSAVPLPGISFVLHIGEWRGKTCRKNSVRLGHGRWHRLQRWTEADVFPAHQILLANQTVSSGQRRKSMPATSTRKGMPGHRARCSTAADLAQPPPDLRPQRELLDIKRASTCSTATADRADLGIARGIARRHGTQHCGVPSGRRETWRRAAHSVVQRHRDRASGKLRYVVEQAFALLHQPPPRPALESPPRHYGLVAMLATRKLGGADESYSVGGGATLPRLIRAGANVRRASI